MGNVVIHHPKISPAVGGISGVVPGIPGVVASEMPGMITRNGLNLLYTEISTLSISNTWSIAFMFSVNSISSDQTLLDIGNTSDDTNRIRVNFMGTVANDPIRLLLYDSGNTLFKQYDYNSVAFPTADYTRWQHVTVTWDGTTLKLYMDGLPVTATALTTDNAGTQTDTARRLSIGSTTAGGSIINGHHKQIALWNSVLTANEVASIFAAGNFTRINLQAPYKDYTSQTSLVHWWDAGEEFSYDSTILRFSDKVGALKLGGTNSSSTCTLTANILTMATAFGFYPGRSYIDMSITRALAAPAALLGIANAWTLTGLTKRVSTTGATWTVAAIANTSNNINTISITILGATANEPWQVSIYNSAGSLIKQYNYELVDCHGDGLLSDGWLYWALTWDGTDMKLYRNAVELTPLSKLTDTTGTMTDTSRQVAFSIAKGLSGVTYRCFASEYAMWDVALSGTEIERLWDGGNTAVDYAEDTAGYYSSSHLKHWWRIGAPPRSIGTTAAIPGLVTDEVASGGMDLSASAVGTPTKTHLLIGKTVGNGGSLHFYSTRYRRSLSAPAGNSIGIANNWTIGYWHYVEATPGTGIENTLLDIGAGGANGIRIFATNALLEIKLWDQNGVLFKHYSVTNGWSATSVWRWNKLSWDGTTLTHTLNNTLTSQTFTKTVDLAGTMADTPRAICIGDNYSGGAPMAHTILSTIQVWNTSAFFALADQHSVYLARNSKDLTKNFGLYNIAGNLQHWWRPGASPSQPGMDYANSATGSIILTPNYDQLAITQWGPC